jgi:hypothetical protein
MKTHSDITKDGNYKYLTPASNLEVGDVINWIGIYDAGTEVHVDPINLLKYNRHIPFKVVDIDYNPNKPDDIIFEFDKVLFPTGSKVITINKDRFAGTDIHNTKVNGESLFDIQKKQDYFNWLVDNDKINLEEYTEEWYKNYYNEKRETYDKVEYD